MPNLDGVSATSFIRTFDFLTPIISVTGSAQPGDVMKYFSSGVLFLFLVFILFSVANITVG
jgi:osomolarity two-component system, response regulator SKN7